MTLPHARERVLTSPVKEPTLRQESPLMNALVAPLILPLVAFLLLGAGPSAAGQETVTFAWESSDRSVIKSHQQYLRSNGAQVGEIEDQDPGTKNPAAVAGLIVAGTVGVCVLADTVVRYLHDTQHGGTIVDTRGGKIVVRELHALDPGTVIIVKSAEDQVEVKHPDSNSLCALLTSALKDLSS